ncbi:helix-turn-helix transcriptional regulator [bacterium]|nr:helix-turn-helix transcriptional regulator [bacterium]
MISKKKDAEKDDVPLFMISVVAKMLDIHPQTLRLYEREGLLKPTRTKGNTRLYSETDIENIKQIMTLTRELGVNLAGVEIIMNLKHHIHEMKAVFSDFILYLQQEMQQEFAGFEEKFQKAVIRSPQHQVLKTVINKDSL